MYVAKKNISLQVENYIVTIAVLNQVQHSQSHVQSADLGDS